MANQQIGLSAVFETAQFNNGLQTYLRGVVQAQAQTTQAASAINSAGGAIAAGFGASLGTVAVDAIRSFINIAQSAVADVIGLASSFEQLEFSIRSLNAGEQLLAGSTEDFNTIFAEQEEIAQGNLLLLQDMAIPSVFTTQQLAAVQQMFQNFGFLNDEAFAATGALTQFATAGNVAPERLNRIAYAISQVRSEGRLLSADARQFGQAGIRIIEILADKLGKTQAQIREDMKDGLLTADIVLPVLFDYFQNFEGVTAESEKTIRGVISALQDIREISLGNFGRGLFDQIMPSLEPILEFLKDERIRAGAQALGELLGPQLATAITAGITALQGMFTTLTSISPQTATFIALLAGGAVVFTAFAGAAGIIALAIGALVTPFTLAVAAVSTFIAAYATNFGNVATITNAVVNAVVSTISGAVGGFNDFASGIADALNSAAQAMGNFLGQVAEWGSAIVSTLAEGITSAVSVVVDAISVLAEAIAYLMAPGSPPRMLPHLTEWGKETANEWLKSWTQADFDILNDISSFVEQALGKDVSADKIIEVNQTIAQAVDQIRLLGQVSEETFAQIQGSLGSASDEVFGYLNRYERLASATNLAEDAQNRLNATTERYDAILAPLKSKLDQATEAVTRAKEAQEAKGLERLLQTTGVSDLRKQEALARLQQIGARQQVADVEAQKQTAVDGLQAELNLATKLKDKAQAQLDLFGQRIQVQNQYLTLLEKEANKASASGGAAAKAHKEGLSALDKQLKLIQLQQQEMQDMIAAAKARKVLEDENATAAQKTTAQLELQEIAVRRQLRDIEAAKLGGTLDAIRQIQIVAADLEKPGKGGGKLDAIAGAAKAIETNFDPKGRLAQFRTKVDEMATSFETMGTKIQEAATKANAGLPVFLRFFNEPGTSGPPPLITNLTAALVGLAAFKFTAVITGLLGLGPAGAIAAAGIGAFVAAFQGNWFGIRDTTIEVVDTVRDKFAELRNIFQLGFGSGQVPLSDQLRGTADPIDNLTFKIGQFAAKVVEDVAKIGPAFAQMKEEINKVFSGEGTVFDKLVEAAGVVVEAFDDNSAVMLALGAFASFMALKLAPALLPAAGALLGLLGPIGIAGLAIAGLYTAWINNIGGIKTWTEQNFPAIGSVITTVVDSIQKAFESLMDAIGSLFGGDFGGAASSLNEGFESLGGGLGKAVGGVGNIAGDLLAQIDVAKITAGITAAVVTIIKSAFNGVTAFLVEGLAALTKGGEGGSALENIVSALTQGVLGAVAGIFLGLYNFLKPENILAAVANLGSLTISIAQGIKQVVFGIFKGITSTIDQFFGTELTPQVTELSAKIDQAWESIRGIFNSVISSIRQVFLGELKAIQGPQGPFQGFNADLTGPDKMAAGPLIEVLEGLKKFINEMILGIQRFFVSVKVGFELMKNHLSPIISAVPGLVDTLISNLDTIRTELDEAVKKIQEFLSNPLGSLFGTGGSTGGFNTELNLLEQFDPTKMFTVREGSIADSILSFFKPEDAQKVGTDLATGIQTGFTTKLGTYEEFKTPMKEIIDAQAAAIGANSPSTLAQTMVGEPIGLGIVKGVQTTLTLQKPVLTTILTLMLAEMATTVTANLETFNTQITTTYTNLRATMNTILGGMQIDTISFQTQSIVGWTLWAAAVQTVVTTSYTLVQNSTSTWATNMLSQYITLRTNLESTVRNMTASVVSLFSDMHASVIAELNAMIRDILSKLDQLIKDIRSKFTEEGEDLGRDFAAGIEKGILDYIDEIRKAATTLAEEAVQAAQDALVAESPSERARVEIGHTFGSGAVLGILDSIPQAIQAAQSLVQSVLASASHTLYESGGHSGSPTTINNVRHYHLNVQSQQASRGVVYDFGILELLSQ